MLNNKIFKPLSNSENGEVSEGVLFYYHQKGEMIWADYKGADIIKGHLLGYFTDKNTISFVYHHINTQNQIKNGKCTSKISKKDNKLILHEQWQWLCDDMSKGSSKLIEA